MPDIRISNETARAFALHTYKEIMSFFNSNPNIYVEWEREHIAGSINDEPMRKKKNRRSVPAERQSKNLKKKGDSLHV